MYWHSTDGVLLPCFNALPDIFVIMKCSVLASSAVFFSYSERWQFMFITLTHYNNKESACRIICMLCQQTSSKRWFANIYMTSYCDVINSVYPATMNTIRHCSIPEFSREAYNGAVALGTTRPLHVTGLETWVRVILWNIQKMIDKSGSFTHKNELFCFSNGWLILVQFFCFGDVSWWRYARFSGSSVPPNTEIELSLCFSLRVQRRTMHWTHCHV